MAPQCVLQSVVSPPTAVLKVVVGVPQSLAELLDDSQPRSQFKPSGGALTVATGAGGAETSLLVWRVADRTLELEQAVLLGSVSKEPFKAAIEFPAPLVPSVTWFATPQGLVAIAAAGSLIFRLFFVADSTVEAVLSSGRQASWCEIFGLKRHVRALSLHGYENATSVAVGCSNGQLLIASLSEENLYADLIELSEGSRLGRFVSGFLMQPKHQDIISVRAWPLRTIDETIVVTLSQDRYLKIWSLATQSCVFSMLMDEVRPEAFVRAPILKSYINIWPLPTSQTSQGSLNCEVAIYLPSESGTSSIGDLDAPSIVVYNLQLSQVGQFVSFELQSERASVPHGLVDFAIQDGALYALTDSMGLSFTKISASTRARWSHVLNADLGENDLLALNDAIGLHSKDAQEVYLDYVFKLGRFSPIVVQEAVASYGVPVEVIETTKDLQLLATQCVTEAVQRQLHATAAFAFAKDVPVHDLQEALRVEWTGFLRRCLSAAQYSSSPLGLLLSPLPVGSLAGNEGLVLVIQRDGLAFKRDLDGAEIVLANIQHRMDDAALLLAPAASFGSSSAALVPQFARDTVVVFNALITSVKSAMSNRAYLQIIADVDSFLANRSFLSLVDSVNLLVDGWLVESNPVATELSAALSELQVIIGGAELAVTMSNICQVLATVLSVDHVNNDSTVKTALDGYFLRQSIVSTFFKMSDARLVLAKEFIMLCILSSQLVPVPSDRVEDDEDFFAEDQAGTTIPLAGCLRHACNWYGILRLVAAFQKKDYVVATPPATGPSAEALASRMSDLSVSNPARPSTFLAAHALLTCQGSMLQVPSNVSFGAMAGFAATGMIKVLTNPTSSSIHSWSVLKTLETTALTLDQIGLNTLVPDLVHETSHRSAVVLVLLARSFIHIGEHEKALDAFLRAATDFNQLNAVFPGLTCMADYLSHVLAFLEDRQAPAASIAIAKKLVSLGGSTKVTPTQLWATVFLNSLRLRRYDDAYEALIALPDRTQQSDFLAHLVTQVCDDHEERRLCQWPFHSLQNDLEKQLEFKANNDAVGLTVQPNYYKILHSWHTCRGDYRKASKAIYTYATRLVNETNSMSFAVWAEYAKSVLAASQSLRLVDSVHAWIAVPRTTPDIVVVVGPDPKRRRVSSVDFESSTSATTADPQRNVLSNVRKLDDLRIEYALAVARLTLTKSFPALSDQAVQLTSKEAIALLVQVDQFEPATLLATQIDDGLDIIFENIIKKCIHSALDSSVSAALADSDNALLSDGANAVIASDRWWHILKRYIESFDTRATHFRYREMTARLVLSSGMTMQLPLWITEFYLRALPASDNHFGDPSVLLRLFLRFGHVQEAAAFACQYIAQEKPSSTNRARHLGSHWLPYTLLDQLLLLLKEGGEKEGLVRMLTEYMDYIEQETNHQIGKDQGEDKM